MVRVSARESSSADRSVTVTVAGGGGGGGDDSNADEAGSARYGEKEDIYIPQTTVIITAIEQ